ncbi:hypothetical protein [Billgrantia sp. C5P2]
MTEPHQQGMGHAQQLSTEFSATIKKGRFAVGANEQFGPQLQGGV